MPNQKPYVIAIDGPSASGKGVTSRRLAEMLGLLTVDTGAMYRTLAWHCLRMKVDMNDDKKVAAFCRSGRRSSSSPTPMCACWWAAIIPRKKSAPPRPAPLSRTSHKSALSAIG